MKLAYQTRQLERLLNTSSSLVREFGDKVATAIMRRKAVLEAVENLGEVSHAPPEKCHELSGKDKGKFSVYTAPQSGVRIVFVPNHDPVPTKNDGGIERKLVTEIRILAVKDYHKG